jgi:hypothetical protein
VARESKSKFVSSDLDIHQKETFEVRPAPRVQAQVQDNFIQPISKEAVKAERLAQSFGMALKTAGQAEGLLNESRKDAEVQGKVAALKGEPLEEGSVFSKILGVQQARTRGYDRASAQGDLLSLQGELQEALLDNAKNDFAINESDMTAKLKQIATDKAFAFQDSDEYLLSYLPKADEMVEDMRLRHNVALDKHVSGRQLDAVTRNKRLLLEDMLKNKAGFNFEEAQSNQDARDAFSQALQDEEVKAGIHKLITDAQGELINGQFSVSRSEVSKRMIDHVGALAEAYGMPELLDALDIKDKDGFAPAEADTKAVDGFRARARSKREQLERERGPSGNNSREKSQLSTSGLWGLNRRRSHRITPM